MSTGILISWCQCIADELNRAEFSELIDASYRASPNPELASSKTVRAWCVPSSKEVSIQDRSGLFTFVGKIDICIIAPIPTSGMIDARIAELDGLSDEVMVHLIGHLPQGMENCGFIGIQSCGESNVPYAFDEIKRNSIYTTFLTVSYRGTYSG